MRTARHANALPHYVGPSFSQNRGIQSHHNYELCRTEPQMKMPVAGFTLLEVLVAVAILAIGLLTILSLHNQSIRANAEINLKTDSAMAGRIYLNYALVKSQYDGFALYFYQDGKSYTIEELYPQFKFLFDSEEQLIGDVQITKGYLSVLNAKDDSEEIKLESLR